MAASSSTPFGIASWMWQQLEALGKQGALYGVPPQVIAAEIQSQNGGDYPVQPNSSGYGFLGLGASTYDTPSGPQQISTALLTGNSQIDFRTLAQIAAGRIATLSTGGNLQQGIISYDGDPSWTTSPGGTLGLLESAGYVVPTSGFQPGTGSPSEKLATNPNAQGGASPLGPVPVGQGSTGPGGVVPTSTPTGTTPTTTTTSSCAIKAPSVLGIGGGCLLASSTLKKIEGGAIALGGAILMVVGGFMLFGGSAVSNISSALRSIKSGQAPKPVKAGPTSSQPSAPSLPETPQVEEPSVPETPDYDEELNDTELRAYYQGVNDGLQAPRTPRKTVGVYHNAVGPGEDDF